MMRPRSLSPADVPCHDDRMGEYEVVVGAGTLRSTAPDAVGFPHRWTEAGATVEGAFTGAHLLHLAAAGCVLNDVFREGEAMGVPVAGVRVTASGGFDDAWASTGIAYAVEVDSPAPERHILALLQRVDEVAEIPKALRAGVPVRRVDA
jgi:uncharacterized OsmC-like protein